MARKKADIKWGKEYKEWMQSNQAELEELAAMESFLDSYLNSGKEDEEVDSEADLEGQLAMFDPVKQMQRQNKEKK